MCPKSLHIYVIEPCIYSLPFYLSIWIVRILSMKFMHLKVPSDCAQWDNRGYMACTLFAYD